MVDGNNLDVPVRGDAPWHCGPPGRRRTYVIADLDGFHGGQGLVVRGERIPDPADPIRWAGPVSLKVVVDPTEPTVAKARERWSHLVDLAHPNLARPIELFTGPGLFRDEPPEEAEDAVLYVAAEWVSGRPLRSAAPLTATQAIALAADLSSGISALHAAGIVHRDLHPGNVVLGDDGTAVIIDYGSARVDDGSVTTTVAGVVGFISPDRLHGPGDAATDRWGVGMLTAFALMGHPQGAATTEELHDELERACSPLGQPGRAADLICAMVHHEPGRRPADPAAWARDLATCTAPAPRGRRRALLVVAPAAVALAVAGLAWGGDRGDPAEGGQRAGTTGTDDGGDPTPAAFDCTLPADRLDPPITPAEEQLAAAVEALAPTACVDGGPLAMLDALYQPLLDDEGVPSGVVMAPPAAIAAPLLMTAVEWASYRDLRIVGLPVNAPTVGGYPVAIERTERSTRVLLNTNGLLVGPRTDTQLFWVPAQVRLMWDLAGEEDGQMGFPTGHLRVVDGALELDFERSYVDVPPGEVEAVLTGLPVSARVEVDNPAAALGDVDDLRGRIITQAGGPSWWVDDEGTRHWIDPSPTSDAFERCGGDANVALTDLAGYAVWSLPLGPAADC